MKGTFIGWLWFNEHSVKCDCLHWLRYQISVTNGGLININDNTKYLMMHDSRNLVGKQNYYSDPPREWRQREDQEKSIGSRKVRYTNWK